MRMTLLAVFWGMGWLPVAAADLDVVCPVTFRGEPLGTALRVLADKLGVTIILDDSVGPQTLETPIRISAQHLSGREVFGWLAQFGNLEIVTQSGGDLLIKKGDLGGIGKGTSYFSDQASRDPRWVAACSIRVPIDWTDAPLSRVAQDISTHYRLDLVVDPTIQERQPLVLYHKPRASLEDVVNCLQDQLKSGVTFVNGALWVFAEGLGLKVVVSSRPFDSVQETDNTLRIERARPASLEQKIRIDDGIRSWSELSDFLNKLDGLSSRMEGSPVVPYPSIRASGTVADVLDGLRLLNFVDWRYSANGVATGGIIDMEIRSRD